MELPVPVPLMRQSFLDPKAVATAAPSCRARNTGSPASHLATSCHLCSNPPFGVAMRTIPSHYSRAHQSTYLSTPCCQSIRPMLMRNSPFRGQSAAEHLADLVSLNWQDPSSTRHRRLLSVSYTKPRLGCSTGCITNLHPSEGVLVRVASYSTFPRTVRTRREAGWTFDPKQCFRSMRVFVPHTISNQSRTLNALGTQRS
jgi:hypothetical protein